MRKNIYNTLTFIFIAIILWSCSEKTSKPVVIAISKTNANYSSWIERNGENATWINVYSLGIDSALKVLDNCDGLLVTGGEDVFPAYYGRVSDTSRCGVFDHYRDSLELSLIYRALAHSQPIFGVCRGEQILNVALGGTLFIDIPEDYNTTVIHRQRDWQNCYHEVILNPGSQLIEISNITEGIVNSNHHQGIDQLGNELLITSYSTDGLPESIEWVEPEGKGFLMAVQWHPERMETEHSLSKNLAVAFLNAANEYQKNKK